MVKTDASGLPLGIQVVGRFGRDHGTLSAARFVELWTPDDQRVGPRGRAKIVLILHMVNSIIPEVFQGSAAPQHRKPWMDSRFLID
jgi:hypothetical protein